MASLVWEKGGGAWVWRHGLLAWEEERLRECLSLLHNIVLQDLLNDRWQWLLEPTQGYSVRGTYRFLTATDEVTIRGRGYDV